MSKLDESLPTWCPRCHCAEHLQHPDSLDMGDRSGNCKQWTHKGVFPSPSSLHTAVEHKQISQQATVCAGRSCWATQTR